MAVFTASDGSVDLFGALRHEESVRFAMAKLTDALCSAVGAEHHGELGDDDLAVLSANTATVMKAVADEAMRAGRAGDAKKVDAIRRSMYAYLVAVKAAMESEDVSILEARHQNLMGSNLDAPEVAEDVKALGLALVDLYYELDFGYSMTHYMGLTDAFCAPQVGILVAPVE